MKQKKHHIPDEQFNRMSCKIAINGNTNDDIIKKGRVLEAELHKELLDEDFKCCPEHCRDCTSILC